MVEAICNRLPRDTSIDFSGALDKPPRILLRMTLTTAGHVQALRETADILDRLLEIANAPASKAPETAASEYEVAQPGEVQGEPQSSGGANGIDS